MASYRPGPGYGHGYDDYGYDGYAPAGSAPEGYAPVGYAAEEPVYAAGEPVYAAEEPVDEVFPEDGLPSRGRRRLPRQRGGSMARSGAVLGVGVFAAVGAGSMATAQEKPPVAISMPDQVDAVTSEISAQLPDAESLPGVGELIPSKEEPVSDDTVVTTAPLTQVSYASDTGSGTATPAADSGEALRARILQQADQQQAEADAAARAAAEAEAAKQAAEEAAEAKAAEEERQRRIEEERRRKAEEEARRKAEAERLAKLAASYVAPLANYTLTSTFGESGDMWAAGHTGQDFAASTGTPVKAVHGGTITEAGWAGSYGYRIVLTLEDGTEIWYCHLSSIIQSSGEVTTADVIGRVGATGNVTGPHLHLEVRPGGGDAVDPLAWLRNNGAPV
ncbi:M23 family metallopeptidase [Streptomyces sp. WMMC500]|uniref:M23 family metallopeptidase n=1 Tax=Streptomyces sp. WMMC500 TaxID=3015154 RepID=UPI00248AF1B8|nr:M23 family metallopeptidase [Streptomyces sp. WMMC500]WBB63982.1 M23 family metallopeptidase [Streptomyces sp. WMMC500]